MEEHLLQSSLFINKIVIFKRVNSPLQQCAFHAIFRSNITSKEYVKSWVVEFSQKTGTGWIVSRKVRFARFIFNLSLCHTGPDLFCCHC